jgi:DNA adenine methylase
MVDTARLSFVKWAGGKNQLLPEIDKRIPGPFEVFIEPFVGGGSVLFHVLQKYKPSKAVVADLNDELITTYRVIRDSPDILMGVLDRHLENHHKDPKEYYYEVRKHDPETLSQVDVAARFIYLNKAGFNGLYRVNSKGSFNVPFGQRKSPRLYVRENFLLASRLLKNVEFYSGDFEIVEEHVAEGSFVYMDPPYYPLIRTSFTRYAKGDFLEDEQRRLYEFYKRLSEKGALCMKSNSYTDFILELYENFRQEKVYAKRLINRNSSGRGPIPEVIIMNYDPQRKGTRMEYKVRDGPRVNALREFELADGTKVGVFPGSRGYNADLDIIIKYLDPRKSNRLRTPQHIHWVIDLIIKREHDSRLTLDFLKYLRSFYDNSNAFESIEDRQICAVPFYESGKHTDYSSLDRYGEYSVEFIALIIELMVRMEKNTPAERPAHVFVDLVDAMIREQSIFELVSRATYKGS